MANLTVQISSLLEAVARDLSAERKTSLDDLVSAALSEYLLSSPRRMYQISTSTALVEGVYAGSVPSLTLLENGDFGLGTFEGLDTLREIILGRVVPVHHDHLFWDLADQIRMIKRDVASEHEPAVVGLQ